MIWDSTPWKAQLAKDADRLEQSAAKRSSGRRSVLLERSVFLAAYSIRKLDEATKLSTGLLSELVGVTLYPTILPGFSQWRVMHIEDHFCMERPEQRELPLRRLVNVLIHSLVFIEVLGPRRTCHGFLVTSDYSAKEGLYKVELAQFVKLMRRAAVDFPTTLTLTSTPDGALLAWAASSDREADEACPSPTSAAVGAKSVG